MSTRKQLQAVYQREGIALVLGAGVSVGSGIPTWVNLLKGMVTNSYEGDEGMFDRLRTQGLSLTTIASLLERRSPSRAQFVESVRNALYAGFPFYPQGTDKTNYGKFLRFVQKGIWEDAAGNVIRARPNTTLQSVGAFCTIWRTPKAGGSGFEVNPRLHAVATLNMDALLQSYVYALTKKHLLRTVERPSARQYLGRVNVYHMHGYLHFDTREKQAEERQLPGRVETPLQLRDAPEAVVLTEQDYYNFFNQPNSLFNYTFLYLLREHTCLFVGLSMDDENIRRLLHYSMSERLEALGNKFGLRQEDENLQQLAQRHFAILPRSDSRQIDHAREESLQPLGVSVVWVDREFKKVPEVLGELYRSAGEDWDRVYKQAQQGGLSSPLRK